MAHLASNETDDRDIAVAVVGDVTEHPPHPAQGSHPPNRIVPDSVSHRFLRIDDRYFFPDRTLAFIDTGSRLKVKTHNLEVVHSVVAIMQARGWRSVQLTGAEEFRQKVWHEATLHGIGVRGYVPGEMEMQQLQRALDQRSRQQGGAHSEASRDAQLDQAGAADVKRGVRNTSGNIPRDGARTGLRPPTRGILLAHAAAPYQFDPMQRMSYYVRVQTEIGERTFSGADLERAIAESRSHVRVGDEVVLSQQGGRPVTVRVSDRNAKGELVGDKKLQTQRMGWRIEKSQYLEDLEQKARLVRDGAVAAGALLARFPDLTGAAVGLQLAGQFAQRVTPEIQDQARVVQAIRSRLADAVAQGHELRIPARRVRQDHVHHRGHAAPERRDPEHARI